ncbi:MULTISPECIES: hypothetical protein [unclassified Streptomyces]|uniref:hypothetical protein n=1 Tax=unclassified Streptomyces TaxID=2593676 RepID=UPI001F2D553A|nr:MULTISPECIES: hypothetical protein [unclassified Streptomyces]MCF0087166.1 hypothetical protein [Streptomyces sp. MH192]MCF0098996.1 hypothetical protein [Streptomyces sp. MH191]
MSKPNKKRYVMATVRQQYAEAVGGEDIEFEGPGGKVFTMPHPMFAPSEWTKAVDEAETDEETALAMLGSEQYQAYIEAGGIPGDVNFIRMAAMEDMKGALKKGRSTRPTQS